MESMEIKCIKCGRVKAVRKLGSGHCFCDHCKIEFDPVDDGDVGYGSQERYAERKEEYQLRQQGRLKREERNRDQLFWRFADRRRRDD